MTFLEFILEGGNVTAINKKGESKQVDKIDLKKFKIADFRKAFFDLFKELNLRYKEKFNDLLWYKENELKDSTMFNGSTAYIMNPNIDPEEILKYKTNAGDVDIMVPKEKLSNLWFLLHDLEDEKIANFTYFGNNRQNSNSLGAQINAVFIYHHKDGDISCQVDFEASDFVNNSPTEWAKFSHGSSFEDAKAFIKAFHHKLLLRAMVRAFSENPNIILATPASTAEKITLKKTTETPRMLQFSVDNGLGYGLEPLLDKNGKIVQMNGKDVYKEKKTERKTYIKDLNEIFHILFKTKNVTNELHSFIGVVSLIKKYFSKKEIQKIQERYFNLLFGKGGQIIELYDLKQDAKVKLSGYDYFLKHLNLKHPNLDKEVAKYYETKQNRVKE